MTKVAVFDTIGSANLAEVIDATASGWCEPLIVNAGRRPWSDVDLAMLSGVVDHVDASGLGVDEVCRELSARQVGGLVAFDDDLLPLVAKAAGRLGLPFHDEQTAAALTHKDIQRHRLAAAGVQRLRTATLQNEGDLAAAVGAVGFPAVLKPVLGAGSANVFPVDDISDLRTALRRAKEPLRLPPIAAEAFSFDSACPWQLEERLLSGAHPAGDWLGDYLSVESVALGHGDYWHFWVTDRLPLAWPFRETGAVGPTLLPTDLRSEVLTLVSAALAALGVASGPTHTEVKLTPAGPRIIEVNGRLGGFIGQMVGRMSDLDPVDLTLRAALGQVSRRPVSVDGFAIVGFVHAPASARTITRVPDPAKLRAIPGVWRVDTRIRPGDRVDYRTGTVGRVQTIWLHCDTLRRLRDSYDRVLELVSAEARYDLAPAFAGTTYAGAR